MTHQFQDFGVEESLPEKIVDMDIGTLEAVRGSIEKV